MTAARHSGALMPTIDRKPEAAERRTTKTMLVQQIAIVLVIHARIAA